MSAIPMELARPFSAEIAERAREFEDQGFISQDLANRLAETGLYRLCNLPKHGGLGGTAREYAEVVEYLARSDASTAWVLFIGMTSALSISNLSGADGAAVAEDRTGITAGVFAPMGRAVSAVQDGVAGYVLSGQWQWGSGSRNCTYLLAGGFVADEAGKIQALENGAPDQRSFFLNRTDVELLDTWHVSGLKGTGSTDFKVADLFVPEARAFGTDQDNRPDSPVYNFPFFGFLGIGIAAVALGIAQASLDAVVDLAIAKTPQGGRRALAGRAATQITVAKVTAQLKAARLFVYDAIEASWQEALGAGTPSVETRRDLRLSLTHAVQTSAGLVTDLYTLAGGSSVYLKNPIQRHFRDVHVTTQHMMVNEATLELVGRLLLDQDTSTAQL